MTFTDKVIDEDTANEIRRVIGMTKIGMIPRKPKKKPKKRNKKEKEFRMP